MSDQQVEFEPLLKIGDSVACPECGDSVPFGQAAVVNDTCAARSAGDKVARATCARNVMPEDIMSASVFADNEGKP